jgi:hypothetical protein
VCVSSHVTAWPGIFAVNYSTSTHDERLKGKVCFVDLTVSEVVHVDLMLCEARNGGDQMSV